VLVNVFSSQSVPKTKVPFIELLGDNNKDTLIIDPVNK